MDVFTRKIRGWQVSQHLTQPLTFRALEQALRQSAPEIHHSDQGVQYLSNAQQESKLIVELESQRIRKICS